MKKQNQKAVTIRFPMGDYLDIAAEAEERNTTTAEVVRQVWAARREHKNLIRLLSKLEQRLLVKVFEICSATVGLSEQERSVAIKELNAKLGKEVLQ